MRKDTPINKQKSGSSVQRSQQRSQHKLQYYDNGLKTLITEQKLDHIEKLKQKKAF